MLKGFLLIFIIVFSVSAKSQDYAFNNYDSGMNSKHSGSDTLRKKTCLNNTAFYAEFAGNGGVYSVNYDRRIFGNDKNSFNIRIGIGYIPSKEEEDDIFIPFELLLITGKGRHHPEFGLGLTMENRPERSGTWEPNLFGRIGYRFQKPDGGWLFRIGFTPYSSYFNDYTGADHLIQPFGGISVGYSF